MAHGLTNSREIKFLLLMAVEMDNSNGCVFLVTDLVKRTWTKNLFAPFEREHFGHIKLPEHQERRPRNDTRLSNVRRAYNKSMIVDQLRERAKINASYHLYFPLSITAAPSANLPTKNGVRR